MASVYAFAMYRDGPGALHLLRLWSMFVSQVQWWCATLSFDMNGRDLITERIKFAALWSLDEEGWLWNSFMVQLSGRLGVILIKLYRSRLAADSIFTSGSKAIALAWPAWTELHLERTTSRQTVHLPKNKIENWKLVAYFVPQFKRHPACATMYKNKIVNC